MPYCNVIGRDTECPLQVCQLSRSSESIHFLSLRSRSFIRFHQSPGWLLRSEARASDVFPDYPEYETPTLSYKAHPNYLEIRIITGHSRLMLTLDHPDDPHMQKNGRFGETPVLRTRPRVEDAAPQNPLPHL